MTANFTGVEATRFVHQPFAKEITMNQNQPNTFSPSYTNSLVQSEAASSFLSLAGTETGRKALLGDPEKLDSSAATDVINAQISLRDGVETIGKLLKDETRNLVQRHEAAGVVAARTVEALEKAGAKIEERANYLLMSGQEDAQATFRLDPNRRFVHEHILAHMTSLASKTDGTIKLRQIIEEDGEAAAVFANTKPYLLNMNADNHRALHFKAIQRHAPDAWAKMEAGVTLTDLAPKFAKAANSVRASFFNPAVAAKASTRVQL